MSDLESKRQELEDYLAEVRAILESRARFENDYIDPVVLETAIGIELAIATYEFNKGEKSCQ